MNSKGAELVKRVGSHRAVILCGVDAEDTNPILPTQTMNKLGIHKKYNTKQFVPIYMQKDITLKMEGVYIMTVHLISPLICVKNPNNYFPIRIKSNSNESMGIKNMNIFEGKFGFVFKENNTSFSTNFNNYSQ